MIPSTKTTRISWNVPTPRANITYPLKFDGWKIKHPIKLDPFQGTFVHFRGVTGGEVQPKSTEMASRYRFNYWMNSQGLAAMGTILLSGAPGGKFAGEQNCGTWWWWFQICWMVNPIYGIFTYMYLVDFYGFSYTVHGSYGRHFLDMEMSRYSRYRSRLLMLCEKYYIVWVWTPEDCIWSNYSDITGGPPKGSWGREIPWFPGHLGWWNIIFWPGFIYAMNRMEDILLSV